MNVPTFFTISIDNVMYPSIVLGNEVLLTAFYNTENLMNLIVHGITTDVLNEKFEVDIEKSTIDFNAQVNSESDFYEFLRISKKELTIDDIKRYINNMNCIYYAKYEEVK